MAKMELRLAGSGGQGVILATIILAEAALFGNKKAVQSQSYGPEARGGMCKAEVIIDDEDIWFTKVTSPTFLLSLTQESLDKYTQNLPTNCLVMADSSLKVSEALKKSNKIICLPILKTAREVVGKAFTANIVAVAAINEALKIVPFEKLKESVMMHIPRGTEEINIKALLAGEKIAKNI